MRLEKKMMFLKRRGQFRKFLLLLRTRKIRAYSVDRTPTFLGEHVHSVHKQHQDHLCKLEFSIPLFLSVAAETEDSGIRC